MTPITSHRLLLVGLVSSSLPAFSREQPAIERWTNAAPILSTSRLDGSFTHYDEWYSFPVFAACTLQVMGRVDFSI